MADRRVLGTLAEGPQDPHHLLDLLVLVGLSGFAVSQPVLSVLGQEPAWFTTREATPASIVAFCLLVALGPPVLLWGVSVVVGRLSRRVGWWCHLGAVGALVGLATLQYSKQLGLTFPAAQAALGLTAGAAGAYAYARFAAVASWARFTAVLPAVAVAELLLISPTADLVRPAGVSAYEGVSIDSSAPSVLFVMLDELPTKSLFGGNGEIDRDRFPNLAALAADSTWYRNYTASATHTWEAVPSILSGREPTHDTPTPSTHPDTLFSLLAPTHELVVDGPLTLCDPSICPPPGKEARSSLSTVIDLARSATSVWRSRVAPGRLPAVDRNEFAEVVESAPAPDERWLDELVGREAVLRRPEGLRRVMDTFQEAPAQTLWYAHVVLPHSPWRFWPDGTEYDPGPLVGPNYPSDARNDSGPWIAALTEQRHLWQLQYTDALLGEVIRRLQAAGRYEDTLVVVTADHGISFELGVEQRTPAPASIDGVAYVPLLIKAPHQRDPVVDDSNMMATDLLPTLAHLLGTEVPWETVGAAAGEPEQRQRGTSKVIHDLWNLGSAFEFDMATSRPSAADRWIAPASEGATPLESLLEPLDVADEVGRRFEDVVRARDPEVLAAVSALDVVTDPGEERPRGIISGRLPGGRTHPDDVVLVGLNGSVVTAAPVIEFDGQPDRFFAAVPPGVMRPHNELRLALRHDGVATEIGVGGGWAD